MATKVLAATALAAFLILTGCAPQPHAGVVGWAATQAAPGAFAPDIPFTAADGTKTTLSKVRESIAVIVFVVPSGENCCWLNPELVNLSNRFTHLPVTIVQVSLPTGACPHGPGCAEACKLDETRIISLCDKDRIAWNAYQQPATGTVFLVGDGDKVVQTATLDNIGPLAKKAEQMGRAKLEQSQPRRARLYKGY